MLKIWVIESSKLSGGKVTESRFLLGPSEICAFARDIKRIKNKCVHMVFTFTYIIHTTKYCRTVVFLTKDCHYLEVKGSLRVCRELVVGKTRLCAKLEKESSQVSRFGNHRVTR